MIRVIRPSETAAIRILIATTWCAARRTRRPGRDAEDRPQHAIRRSYAPRAGAGYEHDGQFRFTFRRSGRRRCLRRQPSTRWTSTRNWFEHGLQLKDATPSNILFEGNEAGVRRRAFDRAVVAGRDDLAARATSSRRHSCLPLLANLECGLPAEVDSLARSGNGTRARTAGTAARGSTLVQLFRISMSRLPAALGGATATQRCSVAATAARPLAGTSKRPATSSGGRSQACGIDHRKLAGAHRKATFELERLRDDARHYSDTDLVGEARVRRPGTGTSAPPPGSWTSVRIPGSSARWRPSRSNVVAVDLDEVSVSAIHSRTRQRQSIQPLVVDLSKPTPAAGWRNQEREASWIGRRSLRSRAHAGRGTPPSRVGGRAARRDHRDRGLGLAAVRCCSSSSRRPTRCSGRSHVAVNDLRRQHRRELRGGYWRRTAGSNCVDAAERADTVLGASTGSRRVWRAAAACSSVSARSAGYDGGQSCGIRK